MNKNDDTKGDHNKGDDNATLAAWARLSDAEQRAAIDAGQHDPTPEVMALVDAAITGRMLTFSDARKIELATAKPYPEWPAPVKPTPGRPAHLRPLPVLMAAARGWYHLLVRLPKARGPAKLVRLEAGKPTVARVRSAVAALGGKPSPQQVLDHLGDADPLDPSTIRRAMKRTE